MPIRIINTYAQKGEQHFHEAGLNYHKLLKGFGETGFSMTLWKEYAEAISPGLSEKCREDVKLYDWNQEVYPVIQNLLKDVGIQQEISLSFEKAAKNLTDNLNLLFDREIDLDIILYLGLCNGAGWATELNGRDTILLGTEKIAELGWYDEKSLKSLIDHEVGHIWHSSYGNFSEVWDTHKEQSMRQLYEEGIAMVCEHILCGDEDYYHQNTDGWLEWCRSCETEVKKEYLRRMNHEESTQDFFGDWCSYQGHSDVGYYLGCRFMEELLKRYSMIEAANLDMNTLLTEFTAFVHE